MMQSKLDRFAGHLWRMRIYYSLTVLKLAVYLTMALELAACLDVFLYASRNDIFARMWPQFIETALCIGTIYGVTKEKERWILAYLCYNLVDAVYMIIIGLPLLLFDQTGHLTGVWVNSNILELDDIGNINTAVGERIRDHILFTSAITTVYLLFVSVSWFLVMLAYKAISEQNNLKKLLAQPQTSAPVSANGNRPTSGLGFMNPIFKFSTRASTMSSQDPFSAREANGNVTNVTKTVRLTHRESV